MSELPLAVAADLRHSRGWLEVLARQREESPLAAEEPSLCQAAALASSADTASGPR